LSSSYAAALGASRTLLRIFRVFNLITGALLIAFLFASFVFEPVFQEFFTKRPPRIEPGLLIPALRIWLLLAAPIIAVIHVLLSRLLAMVETVRAGDPFVSENAARMKTIAWCMLGIQLFDLTCGVMAATMNAAGSNIDWSFNLTGWAAVALLFVLARVFEEGARIRDHLEAMI
jgi:hypothetical protein